MATSFEFKDDRCRQLYEAAYPKGHIRGFAWRESPKTLDNAWNRDTKGKTPEDKDELLKTCLLAGEAQTKYRIEQEKAGERLCRPKGIAVWFNAGDYFAEIGSHAELKEKAHQAECAVDGCSLPVYQPKGDKPFCIDHFSMDENGRMRDNCRLVAELRKHYEEHPEIHGLRGRDAVKLMKQAIMGMVKK